MIESLELVNYRCFEHHKVHFKEMAIIVGKNNAGKSTLIESLRLISIITTKNLIFKPFPGWLEFPSGYKGVYISIAGLDFPIKNLFHKYNNGPSRITAVFSSNSKIDIYIETKNDSIEIFAVIFDKVGKPVKTKLEFKNAEISEINILPQISSLAKQETILNYDYIKSNLTSQLSSIHFRNQIKYYNEHFIDFKKLAEETWQGLVINELDGGNNFKGGNLNLIVRDNDFAAEIGWMGHGLQMWLQTMWFLSKSDIQSTVILDEPDVYMHADLQRKLIRLLKSKYKQIFIATHSIEIISEVEPENILIVDKTNSKSLYAATLPAVQSVLYRLGSIQNIGLTRLWSSRKLLLVEGKDVAILKRIQGNLISDLSDPFDIIPNSNIGGWSGWPLVKSADLILKNGFKQSINIYCILDSDYHFIEEINVRKSEAKKIGIELHIWKKKEIENYLLNPNTIYRLISSQKQTEIEVTPELIQNTLNKIADEMKTSYIDKIADELQSKNKGLQASSASQKSRIFVDENWHNKLDILSGKEILTRFNEWISNNYKTSITPNSIAKTMKRNEIHSEMADVIMAIEKNEKFN